MVVDSFNPRRVSITRKVDGYFRIFIRNMLFYKVVVLHYSSKFFQISDHCRTIRHQGIHRIPECKDIPAVDKIHKKSVFWGLHHHYYKEATDGIIIDRVLTEAPKSDEESYQVPLAKLIDDLFANKNLMLSKGDYPSAIETMFATYRIDQVSMLCYARRKNTVREVFGFLREKTTIELLVQG